MMYITNIKNRKGATLIISYLVIMVLLLLGIAFTVSSIVESRIAESQKKATQAFYIAEAGLERTLYELKQDFEKDAIDPSWADGEINGIVCGPDTVEFYSLPYGSPSLNYSVELKNVSGKDDEIWVRSTGTKDTVEKTVQAYVKMENVFPWNNVIFGGSGSVGTLINGNVDIRGSVLLLGKDLKSTDYAINMSGTAMIGNNYDGMPAQLKKRIPACPTVMFGGETVETLKARLRIKCGLAGLSGTATVGEQDVTGNSSKETIDGVYVTDGFAAEKGEANVYSDNGTKNVYDLGNYVKFPSLSDPYDEDPTYTYQNYLKDNAYVISNPVQLSELANITPKSNFSYGDASGSISMDGNGNLIINGVVYIDGGNLNMNKQGPFKTITYSGRGSIVVTADVEINVNLLTPAPPAQGIPTFPGNILGIITPNTISFNSANIDVMGIFYAENRINSFKQTDVVGTFVSNFFDMGVDVPSIFQVPETVNYLPPGMIGIDPVWFIKVVAWQQV